MNLAKVKEFIASEAITKTSAYPTPREYDLVVRLDVIIEPTPEAYAEVIGSDKEAYTPGFVRNADITIKKIAYKIL